jgi:hypothetical protein
VRGSHPVEWQGNGIEAFLDGANSRSPDKKPSICGWGLNLQHCARTVFVGRSFSYEAWYQAIRRLWRLGRQRPGHAHLIVAEGEDAIGRVIDRKAGDHAAMKASDGRGDAPGARPRGGAQDSIQPHSPREDAGMAQRLIRCLGSDEGERWAAYQGDCVDVLRQMPDASVISRSTRRPSRASTSTTIP